MRTALIVAHARDFAIGVNNQLPWHLSEDLKFFKRVTMGKPMIMGRKTFESIGRPLPGRTNIVVTRDPSWNADGVRVVSSLETAFELATDISLIDGAEECMVIGGGQIYEEAFSKVDRMYLTLVETTVPDADAYFPQWDPVDWNEMDREERKNPDPSGPDYQFLILDRKA